MDELRRQAAALAASLEAATEVADIERLSAEAETLNTRIAAETVKAERIAALRAAGPVETPAERQNDDAPVTPAQRFVQSEQYRAFIEVAATRGTSGAVRLPSLTRAVIDTGALAGAPKNVGPYQQALVAPAGVASVFDNQSTDVSELSHIREVLKANAADFVAEGAAKPEQMFEMEEVKDTTKTVAVYANITRQAARSQAKIMGLLEGRLSSNVDLKIDDSLINGNGTTEVTGALHVDGRNIVVADAGTAGDGAAMAAAIRTGMTKVRILGLAKSDATLVNSEDWQTVEMSTDTTGRYLLVGSPADEAVARLWGTRVVDTPSLVKGTALTGAFKTAATVWHRDNGVQVYITDSHASNFTLNILTVLAEKEFGVEWYRPSAISEVRFTA